jgi:hypothetical protein
MRHRKNILIAAGTILTRQMLLPGIADVGHAKVTLATLDHRLGRRHVPARHAKRAPVRRVAHDRCRVVREDARKRRHIADVAAHCPCEVAGSPAGLWCGCRGLRLRRVCRAVPQWGVILKPVGKPDALIRPVFDLFGILKALEGDYCALDRRKVFPIRRSARRECGSIRLR